jgi:hypothetical protein
MAYTLREESVYRRVRVEARVAEAIRLPRRRGITAEITALFLMTVGSIVPVLGWGAGVILLWMSRRWRVGEKLLATLVFPFGPFAALYLTGLALPLGIGITVLIAWVVAPFAIAGILIRRAADRAATEPPV